MKPSGTVRVASILWFAALAGLALVAVNVAFDREARRYPAYAQWVLPPFRSNAQVLRVVQGLQGSSPASGLADAYDLVLARPMPAEHLTLLAVAEQRAGKSEKALRAFQIAATRGWRAGLPQQAALAQALETGANEDAAMRLAALWAVGDETMPILADTSAVLGSPAGQRAFAQMLAGSRTLGGKFLAGAMGKVPADKLAPTLATAICLGVDFDRTTLQALVRMYVRSGHVAAAGALSNPQCGAGASTAP